MSDTHFLCFSEQSNCATVFVGNADPSELFPKGCIKRSEIYFPSFGL